MSRYSLDLRKKVLAYLQQHQNLTQTSKTFSVCRKTIYTWLTLDKKKNLEGKTRTYKPLKLDYAAIADYVKKHEDAYIREIATSLGYSKNGVFKALKKMKITLKKSLKYRERNENKGKLYKFKLINVKPERLIYIDECGIDEYLYRPKARSIKGERAWGGSLVASEQKTDLSAVTQILQKYLSAETLICR